MNIYEKRIKKIEDSQPKHAAIEEVLSALDSGKELTNPMSPGLVELLAALGGG